MLRRALACLVLVAASGCSAGDPVPEPAPTATTTPTATAPTATAPTAAPTARPSGYAASSRPLTRAEQRRMRGVTWRPGCPVPLADLRVVRLAYRDFGGDRRTGRLVVHRDVVADVTRIFRRLYVLRFPIRRMVPIEAYDGDDHASIEADNTSAFNCRAKTGSSTWSHHAYGRAIDLNPLENPYVYGGGRTSHERSIPFLDRGRDRPGVLLADGPVVAVFEQAGWYWAGRWEEPTDYQHFSAMPDPAHGEGRS